MVEPVLDPAAHLDALGTEQAGAALFRCCGSTRFCAGMLARRPFGSRERLFATARAVWAELGRDDYLEAFSHHPAIGGNLAALRSRDAASAAMSGAEQSAVAQASEAMRLQLASGNAAYQARFGYVFLVCATGKTAAEILALLEARLRNDAETELRLASEEQAKITELRLEKIAA
jgi:2-oxo-4-hydroxy-4-carboxy-5-ureidoimidazoline decarboxylase